MRKFVSFDWAIKRLLRSKANFAVLEGFLSELLQQDIQILEVLESETNRTYEDNKSTRVDLLVKDQHDERIIVEVQYQHELDYFQRIMFGASKIISETLAKGEVYGKCKKLISVSILYFDLGQGTDYVYIGQTEFHGIHNNEKLMLSAKQKEIFGLNEIKDIYPEYYLLKINDFNDVAKNGLDEWIYFFKHEDIKGEFKAKGLDVAKEKLDYLKLAESERKDFERYEENRRHQASIIEYSIKEAEHLKSELQETRKREEEERRLKEEAQKREEEERRLRKKLLEKSLAALVATGLSETDAKKCLGLIEEK